MTPSKKETPASGCNHCAGVNTQNDMILRVLSLLESIVAEVESVTSKVDDTATQLDEMREIIDGLDYAVRYAAKQG